MFAFGEHYVVRLSVAMSIHTNLIKLTTVYSNLLFSLNGCLPTADIMYLLRLSEAMSIYTNLSDLNEKDGFERVEWMSASGRHWYLLRLSVAMSIHTNE
jgi:hypothetical protein